MGRYANMVQHAFRSMSYMPLAFITAKTGKNVKALINLAQSLFKQSKKRVGTGTLNRIVREAVEAHPPASRENRTPRIYYATQVGVAPPTDRSVRQQHPALRRDLSALPAQRLPRKTAVPRHPDQALHALEKTGGARRAVSRPSNPVRPTRTSILPPRPLAPICPRQAPMGGHFDIASRFLNHEVNELLSELDN